MASKMDLSVFVARRVEVRRYGDLVEIVYSENMAGAQSMLKPVATIELTAAQARALSADILIAADEGVA